MGRRLIVMSVFVSLALAGCAASPPKWRFEAITATYAAKVQGAQDYFPDEFKSTQVSLTTAENYLQQGEKDEAEKSYLLVLRKSEILQQKTAAEHKRLEEERRRAEAEKLESDRLVALEQLKKKLEDERKKLEEAAALKPDKPAKVVKERPLPLYHTVKRGETLPQIAAQADVYNDSSLWPILYRANRDQIRDPRRIWPGQVLRIPRPLRRDDIEEARKYSQERQIP